MGVKEANRAPCAVLLETRSSEGGRVSEQHSTLLGAPPSKGRGHGGRCAEGPVGSRDVKPHLRKVAKGPEDTADGAGARLRAGRPFKSAEASAAAA